MNDISVVLIPIIGISAIVFAVYITNPFEETVYIDKLLVQSNLSEDDIYIYGDITIDRSLVSYSTIASSKLHITQSP